MSIPAILQIEEFRLSQIAAQDGTKGILMLFRLHPELGQLPPVQIVLTEGQATDLSQKLAAAVSMPRTGQAKPERTN